MLDINILFMDLSRQECLLKGEVALFAILETIRQFTIETKLL